ncbi:MAG: phosphoribosylaminoimidazolecarboxamide formyltransferase [Armatimonadota bacterium]
MSNSGIQLRYGCNPHQGSARAYAEGEMPLRVLNGAPGYINLLDALNAWQLVQELRQALDLPAATSFKHVCPSGAAVAAPMSPETAQACMVGDLELSPLATAYARARGADRVASYGDFVALSDPADASTAIVLAREVSDGVIAPGYEPDALEILKGKKQGGYLIMQIDPEFKPAAIEKRDVFGITMEQERNDALVDASILENVVTKMKEVPADAVRDLLVASIALKYTPSNSICLAHDGQTIGVGAGQQSRILCTRLAASKADIWYLRQHPRVLEFKFREGARRPDMNNAIYDYLIDELVPAEMEVFEEAPVPLAEDEKREWLDSRTGASLSSDGFIPFRDNLDRAARSGVSYVVQPGGSIRDDDIIAAADELGMAMAFSGLRLFHH